MKINIGVICQGPIDFNNTKRGRYAVEGIKFIPLWIEAQALGIEFHGIISTRLGILNHRHESILKTCKQRCRELKQSSNLVLISECDHGYKGPNKHDRSCKLYCGMKRGDYESKDNN